MQTKTLDLGSGANPQNPLNASEIYGIDVVDFGNPNIRIADLVIEPIPFEDSTFDCVSGFDFLEHIPRVLYIGTTRRQPFIDLMSEVWRVLKPNGVAFFSTPSLPYPEAFQDPQHVNFITDKTIMYFCKPSPYTFGDSCLEMGKRYGFKGAFEILVQARLPQSPSHLVWQLRAIK